MVILRALAVCTGLVWLVASVARGGLRAAFTDAQALLTQGAASAAQPDARKQWTGAYFDALDALVEEATAVDGSVAVVLGEAETPDFPGPPPTQVYEAIYRLYPTRVDIYSSSAKGGVQAFWFDSPPEQVPIRPALWEHEIVLVAFSDVQPPPGYEVCYGNVEAQIYRRRGR
jgi:hypothetical protein